MKFWNWIKTYWKYVLMSLALLASAIFGFLLRGKRTPVVLPSVDDNQKKVEAETNKEEQAAEKAKEEQIQKILDEHNAIIQQLDDEQKKKFEELSNDPEDLTNFLLEVGKNVRGDNQ